MRGRGGHGNKRFATSTRQAPRFAEKGTKGEEGWIELRLKLLADVGLVGLPNAGKSSLLGRLTRAAPKVADYPFTTLSPVLGTIEGEDRQAVVADIPGPDRGAAEGAGLGHEFLAHVERCAMLVHLVELAPLEGDPVAQLRGGAGRARRPTAPGSTRLPELVVLSKRDLLPEPSESRRRWPSGASGSATRRSACSPSPRRPARGSTSCAQRILAALPETAPPAADRGPPSRPAEFEAEHRVYRPAGEGGYCGRARGGRRLPRHSAAASSCSSSATTSPTRRRSPTSSSASTRSASSPPCAPPASSPATTSASASTSSSCTPERDGSPLPKRAASCSRVFWEGAPVCLGRALPLSRAHRLGRHDPGRQARFLDRRRRRRRAARRRARFGLRAGRRRWSRAASGS